MSSQKWYEENKERMLSKYKRAYRNKPEHYRAKTAQYRKEHPDKILASAKKFRDSETAEKVMWGSARSRAKKKGLEFSLKVEDIQIPAKCPILGVELKRKIGSKGWCDESPTLDRIVSTLGYVPGNVCVISWRANRLKSDGTPEEFESIVKYFKQHQSPA